MGNTIIPDRQSIPLHGKPITLVMNEPEVVKFDNGIKAYIIDAGDEEVIRIDITIKAGSAYQDKRLVASSVGKMLNEGTEHFSSSEIAEKFDSFGAHLDSQITKDAAVLSLFSLTKHLHELLPVIGDMISTAVFHEEELNTYIDRQRQEFLVNNEKVRYRAMLEFNKMVFGENSAYGQVVQLEDFDKLHRNDLLDFYKKRYVSQNVYVIISGKIGEEVVSLANKYLGNGWHSTKIANHDEIHFLSETVEKERFVKKEGAMQSAIRVGRSIISKKHPDYNRFVLLNTILGGYFGSRLMSNLREDKGYTYGVSSFVTNYINGGAFSIATEVNAKFTQSALDEIYLEIEKLRTEKVGHNELELVKNYIYGTFLRNFDGPFSLAERYRSARDFGMGFDFYRKSLDEILTTTADELIETANKYLNPEEMIRLIVGSME